MLFCQQMKTEDKISSHVTVKLSFETANVIFCIYTKFTILFFFILDKMVINRYIYNLFIYMKNETIVLILSEKRSDKISYIIVNLYNFK